MNKKHYLWLWIMIFLVLVSALQAQEIQPSSGEVDPQANISWPPPVYTLSGLVEIRGTASVVGMSNYFVQYRPLVFGEDAPSDENRPWFPATTVSNTAVTDGVLGVWDTTIGVLDGLYELRLVINTASGPQFFVVSPLRVENNPPDFVVRNPMLFTPTPNIQARPTLAPTPTPLERSPRVTALVNANVREGDSTQYKVVGFLEAGQSVDVIGVSSFGTGWYYIQLPDGKRGFVAPSVVSPSGDIRSVQRVNPPPPPTPIATATPLPSGNLHFVAFYLDPSQPTCNQTFTVYVGIENNGTTATLSGGTISVRDVHVASGTTTQTTVGSFPVLPVGGQFTAIIPLTVSTYFDEEHEIWVVLDANANVQESNENDNISTLRYVLSKGSCG